MFSDGSSLLIHDSLFQNNSAAISGGGMLVSYHSSLIIEDSSFINNSAPDEKLGTGGGLTIMMNSVAMISSVRLFDNKARKGGGAIYVANVCQVTILNSSFVNNTGAIFVNGNISMEMDNCRVLNNLKVAVFVSSSNINVTNTRFSHNVHGTFDIQSTIGSFCNCTFTDNSASKGGALTAVASNIQFITCYFIGNSATNGGVFSISGNLLLKNCVVTNNTAHGDGGVGYLKENSNINITSSIFRKNSAAGSGGVFMIRNSTANIWNSSFVSNRAGTYGGVIDTQYFSAINISQTSYYGNIASVGGALYGRATRVFVNDSTMHRNSAFSCSAMVVEGTSVLEISFGQAHINNSNRMAGAFCAFHNSLLVSKSLCFEGNTGNYEGLLTLNSSTGYLENCTLIGNHGIKATAINFLS